ncbi:hypothetical protein TMatcc_003476 [Talaromyces marneffei ATCC 18224]
MTWPRVQKLQEWTNSIPSLANKPQQSASPVDDPSVMQIRAADKDVGNIAMNELPDKTDMKPSADAQSDVRETEAVTLTWSRGSIRDVLAADATNLRNRDLAFAFTSSLTFIPAFAGSKAAAEFFENV